MAEQIYIFGLSVHHLSNVCPSLITEEPLNQISILFAPIIALHKTLCSVSQKVTSSRVRWSNIISKIVFKIKSKITSSKAVVLLGDANVHYGIAELFTSCLGGSNLAMTSLLRRFPAEWEAHKRTFMAWPHLTSLWNGKYLNKTQEDIVRLTKAIAKFEPVVLLTSPDQMDLAKKMFGETDNIEFASIPVDDLWARDTVPVFVKGEDGSVIGIDLNFNGWGNKQVHGDDTRISKALCSKYNLTFEKATLVSEGGALETDGEGTLLATESSLVNENRNPGKSKEEIEDELRRLLGVTKVIWFKGVKGGDITDAHVDGIARFASPGVVVLNRQTGGDKDDTWSKASDEARNCLEVSTDAKGRKFKIVELPEPDRQQTKAEDSKFFASYINYLVVNGAVIVPKFGDVKADENAKRILQGVYPGMEIVTIQIDNIAPGGGGIHCATHDQPE